MILEVGGCETSIGGLERPNRKVVLILASGVTV